MKKIISGILALFIISTLYAYKEADLEKFNKDHILAGGDLSNAYIADCNRNAHLYSTDITGINFTKATFWGTIHSIGSFEEVYTTCHPLIIPPTFSQAKFDFFEIERSKIPKAKFNNAVIENSEITDSDLRGADFNKATLTFVRIYNSDFSNTNFTGATIDMLRTRLEKPVCFEGASFKNTKILRSLFLNTDLKNSNFSNAEITFGSFKGSDLTGATLDGTYFDSVEMPNGKMYTGTGEDYKGPLKPEK